IVANSRMVYEDTRDKLDSENSERLKRLETSALNMARLIEDLLQFARIGQVALHVRDIDLTAMANEIAKHLQSMKQGSVIVQEGMVTRGDPEMIRMVLFNLMENAWKYTPPEKTPEVEVGSTHDRKFFVRDHGVGFDMRYVDKIWEPFERLHRETEYPGTGIGLANSKRIVTRHGGKMWAESAVGQGTTVYFQLQNSCVESPVAVL
ncbi:MAG TPA: ATP-binding protein, partial [Fimbriimonas sp.]|nr:ATP-binding protein [Fimbriimonas sp.]